MARLPKSNRPPQIGWEKETPVPDGTRFTDYLWTRGGDLYYEHLNLGALVRSGRYRSPLEIVYLPQIRRQIDRLRQSFTRGIAELGYPGRFEYAYASKANAAEEVVRTIMDTPAHYEMSSATDIDIARLMKRSGRLADDKMVLCNGFKLPGSSYSQQILAFKAEHDRLIPILENPVELEPLAASGLPFEVGLRQKSYGSARDLAELDQVNSRFGMPTADLEACARQVAAASNLSFKMLHAMAGSQITDPLDFVGRLVPSMELFARLRREHPTLSIFNFGGGVPVGMTLDFQFDYDRFARELLRMAAEVCGRHGVLVPDVMGEMGRYTVSEHGAHLFKIVATKENGSSYPWYIIDGSIMSSFPDSWALGELFIVLPLTHLDRPFRRVQLGGLTCDSDDMYPRNPEDANLFLPVDTAGLTIGFFSVGAYQEMLGGVGGTKHCAIPEADELIIDRNGQGELVIELVEGQDQGRVLRNLGYRV